MGMKNLPTSQDTGIRKGGETLNIEHACLETTVAGGEELWRGTISTMPLSYNNKSVIINPRKVYFRAQRHDVSKPLDSETGNVRSSS